MSDKGSAKSKRDSADALRNRAGALAGLAGSIKKDLDSHGDGLSQDDGQRLEEELTRLHDEADAVLDESDKLRSDADAEQTVLDDLAVIEKQGEEAKSRVGALNQAIKEIFDAQRKAVEAAPAVDGSHTRSGTVAALGDHAAGESTLDMPGAGQSTAAQSNDDVAEVPRGRGPKFGG